MILPLFAFLSFTHLVHGISLNTTGSDCPPVPEGAYRSVWSVLGSCVATLLICVWHAVHPGIPPPNQKWYTALWGHVRLVLLALFFPEMMILRAAVEWQHARRKVDEFHENGFRWSMTHGYFAGMGGFAYREDQGDPRTIYSSEFLRLCKEKKILNPGVTAEEILDKSKSDALGKIIFTVQLTWFILQVVFRIPNHLAITLVELDTLCNALLTIPLLVFWWSKPLRPRRRHIFYSCQFQPDLETVPSEYALKQECPREESLTLWSREGVQEVTTDDYEKIQARQGAANDDEKLETSQDANEEPGLEVRPNDTSVSKLLRDIRNNKVPVLATGITWAILAGLHMAAWKFDFPTAKEKLIWLIASVYLLGAPLLAAYPRIILVPYRLLFRESTQRSSRTRGLQLYLRRRAQFMTFMALTVPRLIFMGLALASLRQLPCTAYENVLWTIYVPHL